MPAGMGFEEAAAVTDGMILALMCLEAAHIRKEQRVLVYGASGSIGTAGVQLAKYFGADVTAVCNTKNVELVRSLGAGRVIDYTKEDFTKNGETYDVILDAVGMHSFSRCRVSLKRGGVYVAGKYRAVIDRRYPLEQVVEATRYVETKQKTGNVVLTVKT
ncbi:MAG: hypothetical protein NVSMB62_29140 [Acidobacteriaceae bacterium]